MKKEIYYSRMKWCESDRDIKKLYPLPPVAATCLYVGAVAMEMFQYSQWEAEMK